MNRLPLIVVAGPTASGKTSLAIALAKALDGEVVSADSMQIYQGIPVATAVPSMVERDGVIHHLMEYVSLSESYSVARYAKDSRERIDDIHRRGKMPILCGGTGLYIAAVTDHVCYEEQDDEKATRLRSRLRDELEQCGEQAMWDRLHKVDPAAADKLHMHDHGRVLRALEVFELTGVPMSEQQKKQKAMPSPYDVTMVTLDFRDRAVLYDRINRRVDLMMQNGLLEETASVVRLSLPTAMQAIGCKELRPYFDGECSLQQALEDMKRRSRQYAKRQLSWFRRIETARTYYVDDYSNSTALADAVLADYNV